MSFPVYTLNSFGMKEYIDIVDILDLLAYTLLQPGFANIDAHNSDTQDHFMYASGRFRIGRQEVLSNPLSDLQKLRGRPVGLSILDESEPLAAGLKHLSGSLHRVLVRCEGRGRNLHRFISQTDILRYITSNLDPFKNLKRILETPAFQAKSPVTTSSTITVDQPALDAFRLMLETGLPAVGVVDSAGRLVGNISASDLNGFSDRHVAAVVLPATEFLSIRHDGAANPPVCASDSDSVLDVVTTMLRRRIHSVWCLDESGRPVGSLSMADV
eukprot:CAMPEP_0196661496 /NCGR_PEP_ID=MMETSP1086-20130531/44545_1 /TAXON_ID=77921 /ORGANISM="Cyanoptyche  gloeocystis , Strain SAG4.97" /LENGTH=270 /DNA_ID=CAMNT_0041996421 /DNA_START=245 /DNA_END=1054 /DNA_ORIENTATION=-